MGGLLWVGCCGWAAVGGLLWVERVPPVQGQAALGLGGNGGGGRLVPGADLCPRYRDRRPSEDRALRHG